MDIAGIAALATDLAQMRTAQAIQLAVLKLAIKQEAQGALQLVQAAAQVGSANPPHLGQNIDAFA